MGRHRRSAQTRPRPGERSRAVLSICLERSTPTTSTPLTSHVLTHLGWSASQVKHRSPTAELRHEFVKHRSINGLMIDERRDPALRCAPIGLA
jgi:hypothetical protein